MGLRKYPVLKIHTAQPELSISFVVVKFSDEYYHNIYTSECVHYPSNELITIDNSANLNYPSLSEAMHNGGLLAKNNIIAFVHEDVVLPQGWQRCFEESLKELEKYDPEWGILGSVGWIGRGKLWGHWSDPREYTNSLRGKKFREVAKIDEQILIMHKNRLIPFDLNLPGIHHIGWDLPLIARQNNYKTYVINAPTIHKFADKNGKKILNPPDSPKITDRTSQTYLADRAHCNIYLKEKWPGINIYDYDASDWIMPAINQALNSYLDSPLIFIFTCNTKPDVSRYLCQKVGISLEEDTISTKGKTYLKLSLLLGLISKYHQNRFRQTEQIVKDIRIGGARLLKNRQPIFKLKRIRIFNPFKSGKNLPLKRNKYWGINEQESMYLIPEIDKAFPNARFIYMSTPPDNNPSPQNTNTSSLDNHIGRITLTLVYNFLKKPKASILEDSPSQHKSSVFTHQKNIITTALAKIPASRCLMLDVHDETKNIEVVKKWLNTTDIENLIQSPTP